jgi:hypothetical protein
MAESKKDGWKMDQRCTCNKSQKIYYNISIPVIFEHMKWAFIEDQNEVQEAFSLELVQT